MTSKVDCSPSDVPRPKTPHEEIMLCIESTNDIVSKILERLEAITFDPKVSLSLDLNKLMEQLKKAKKK